MDGVGLTEVRRGEGSRSQYLVIMSFWPWAAGQQDIGQSLHWLELVPSAWDSSVP